MFTHLSILPPPQHTLKLPGAAPGGGEIHLLPAQYV